MENEKYLFVVSGAAGTGKDSVVNALRAAHPEIEKTVSATTRSPRPGEQEGVDYYYRSQEQFQQLIANDEVVEYNFYNGNYYGTLKEEIHKRLEAGKLVVLGIDVHGAMWSGAAPRACMSCWILTCRVCTRFPRTGQTQFACS